jgi:pilus assembly protein Flp/PilA
MARYMNALTQLVRDEEGATAVEYGIMIGFIALAIITAVAAVGRSTANMFNGVNSRLN